MNKAPCASKVLSELSYFVQRIPIMQGSPDTDFGFTVQIPTKAQIEGLPQQITQKLNQVEEQTSVCNQSEYFAQEISQACIQIIWVGYLSQGGLAFIEEFYQDPFAKLDSQGVTKPKHQTVALFGFPFELPGEYEMERRVGIELGPEKVFSAIKSSSLAALQDDNSRYYEFLSTLPPPGAIILEEEATIQRYFSQTLEPFDLIVGLGGGNHLLNTFFAHIENKPKRRVDYLIKISPKLSRKNIIAASPAKANEAAKLDIHGRPLRTMIHNNNYVSALKGVDRSRVIHFGALDNETTQKEYQAVTEQDKSKVIFLDKQNQRNVDNFKELLSSLHQSPNTDGAMENPAHEPLRIGLSLDCESIVSGNFPGVSNPAIFGLTHVELVEILKSVQMGPFTLSALLFTNFNPAIEADRSGRYLTALIHGVCRNIKNKSAPSEPRA